MTNVWLTYAWVDNERNDVDFIVQELRNRGLTVNIDRERIVAGRKLWDQIEHNIMQPENCSAWAFVVSKNSLQSAACREELAYALDRALNARGQAFPLIGILFEPVDESLIPAAIRVRLYVTIRDSNWADRVAAGVVGNPFQPERGTIEPYEVTKHSVTRGSIIELRPRAGTWYPCMAMVPVDQAHFLLDAFVSPSGTVPMSRVSFGVRQGQNSHGFFIGVEQRADPSTSFFIELSDRPRWLMAGPPNECNTIWGSPPYMK